MCRHSLALLLLTLMALCCGGSTARAQVYSWAQLVDDYLLYVGDLEEASDNDVERLDWLEVLEDYHRHPLPINTATREDLLALHFLSDVQIDSLLARRDRYAGGLRSLGELLTVPQLSYRDRQWLSLLLRFDVPPAEGQGSDRDVAFSSDGKPRYSFPRQQPDTTNCWRDGQHEVMATLAAPIYRRAGFTDWTDDNYVTKRFLGAPMGHSLRYRYNWLHRTTYGLTVEQDVGERLAAYGAKPWDFSAAYFYHRSPVHHRAGQGSWSRYEISVGDYRLTLGQGLIMGGDSWNPRSALLRGVQSATTRLRPHTGTDENRFLRGAAATVRLGPSGRWSLTAWGSWRRLDASVKGATAANAYDPAVSDTVTAWKTDGLHRTLQETRKRGVVRQLMAGTRVGYDGRQLHLGATAMHVAYDRIYCPALRTYNRHVLRGNQASALSLDYTFQRRRWSLQGEAALDRSSAYAITTALRVVPLRGLSVVLQERSFGRDFVTPYGHPLQAGSQSQNEHGALLGLSYRFARPLGRIHELTLTAYGDAALHPAPVYLADTTSHRAEATIEATWRNPRGWAYAMRYRVKGREQNVTGYRDLDDFDDVLLAWRATQHLRFQATHTSGPWSLTLGGDAACYHSQGTRVTADGELTVPTSLGAAAYVRTAWRPSERLRLQGAAALFATEDYDSRCYAYFPQLNGSAIATSAFYGRGFQIGALIEWHVWRGLHLAGRLTTLHYLDRDTISSGVNLIHSPWKSDLALQMRWVI